MAKKFILCMTMEDGSEEEAEIEADSLEEAEDAADGMPMDDVDSWRVEERD